MIAQVYKDNCQMRIFDRCDILIATIQLGRGRSKMDLRASADNALRRLRMKRREEWCDVGWGSEAKIRFMEKKK